MAIIVPLLTEYDAKGVDRMLADFRRADGAAAKIGVGLKKALVPATAALGALAYAGFEFAKAAADDEAAAGRMASSLQKVAGATDAQVAGVEAWITAQGKALGVADDQLRPAMSKLAMATGDVGKAQDALAVAMDVAQATGKPLETVVAAMSKGFDGSAASLKKLVPGLDAAAIKSGDMTAIMADLKNKTGGAAAEFAGTAAGSMQRLTLAMDETKESLGAALLPAFEAILPYLQQFGTWAQENTGTLLAIVGAIAALAAGVVVANAAMAIWNGLQLAAKAASAAWTGAQWLLNAALTANPIGLVVLAIAALVGALILAYNKVDWFRAFVDTAFAAVKTAISTVVNWFRDTAWPILQRVFGWIGDVVATYIGAWQTAFGLAKTAVETVWNWLRDTFGPLLGDLFAGIGIAADTLGKAFDTAFGLVKSAVSAAWDFIQPILTKIHDAVKAAIDAVASLPGVGSIVGAVTGQGRVAPVPSMRSGARAGATVNVTVQAGIGNPVEIARTIENVLRTRQIRLGVA